MAMTNTVAYYDIETIMAVKSFIVLGPWISLQVGIIMANGWQS
jgi:hypothetical protein